MAKTDNLTDFLTGVADAIRTKKGTTAKINPQNFETEIKNISTRNLNMEQKVAQIFDRQIVEIPSDFFLYFIDIDNIGSYMFMGCSKLKKVSLPLGYKHIYNYAFKNCVQLANMYISSNTYVDQNAFEGCNFDLLFKDSTYDDIYYLGTTDNPYNLLYKIKTSDKTGYTINPQTERISIGFSNCSNLESIVIPKNIEDIEIGAFIECPSLTTITVDSENIHYRSQNDCIIVMNSNILWVAPNKNISIPDDVEIIAQRAFEGRDKITKIEIIGSNLWSIKNSAFERCTGLEEVTIGDSVTEIGVYAFRECTNLTEVVIPGRVENIGYMAFGDCSRLTSVTVISTTPPFLGGSVFPSNVTTITVPAGCGNAYKSASGWSAYADKIVEATA